MPLSRRAGVKLGAAALAARLAAGHQPFAAKGAARTMQSDDTLALVGQSMMFRFPGPELSDDVRDAFARVRPAGVLFFADNIDSRPQVHALCTALQDEARALGLPPLLIAADQEGGMVSRLLSDPDFITVPSAMAQGATDDEATIETFARITGEQLREVGINVNFAPVLDVNVQPDNTVIRTRSFGDTPERVTLGGLATIRGLAAAGVAATAKHFPGHGDTAVDSHVGLPVIEHGLDRLREVELAPFKAAAEAGVPAVMSAHIVFPVFDDRPATLSPRILTGLLRQELGFDGVIFSDSMSMDAITDRYGTGTASVRAKLAGIDVLESHEDPATQIARVEAMAAAIADGSAAEELFTRSAERVAALRERFDITYDVPPLADPPAERAAEVRRLAPRGITVRGDFQPLPREAEVAVIDFQRYRTSEAEDPVKRARVMRETLAEVFPNATHVALSQEPSQGEASDATAAVEDAEQVIVLTRDARDSPQQTEFARQIIAARPEGTPVFHVAVRGPYDAGLLPDATATLFLFGDPAVTLRALVDVLAGDGEPGGTLPVSLPDFEG